MKVLWTDDAIADWQNIAMYIATQFGETAFNDFDKATDAAEQMILQLPLSGMRMQSRKNPQIDFRFVLINKLSKMIYHIVEDTIYIDIFWDVCQNPKTLNKRISRI